MTAKRGNGLRNPSIPTRWRKRWQRTSGPESVGEIVRHPKSKAEAQFAASQKKSEKALKEKQKIQQERADKTARLRALRLARDNPQIEPDPQSEMDDTLPQLPNSHRRQS